MAIRNTVNPNVGQVPKPVGDAASSRLSAAIQFLVRSGIAATPQEAKQLLQMLQQLLGGAGFAGSSVEEAIKQFQTANGQSATGQLDDKTLSLLQSLGLWPQSADDGNAAHSGGNVGKGSPQLGKDASPNPTGSKQTAKPNTSGINPRSSVVNSKTSTNPTSVSQKNNANISTSQQPSALSLLQSLGQKASFMPVQTGAAGQRNQEIAHAHAFDRAQWINSGSTWITASESVANLFQNLRSEGFWSTASSPTQQLREMVQKFQQKEGLPTSGSLDERTLQRMQERGVLGEQNNPTKQTERPTDHPAGFLAGDGFDLHSFADGNAASGDENKTDERRGQSSVDDQKKRQQEELEYYEVPTLQEQSQQMLRTIHRDDDGMGRATYGWEIYLYKPGIYASGQAAEVLLHLAVAQASAFDRAWADARAAIQRKVEQYEPDGIAPSAEDFAAALRRARVQKQ